MPAHSLLAVVAPAVATGLATSCGALPFLMLPSVSRRAYDTLLGLGAGLMLAAATLGLLSSALAEVRPNGQLDVGTLLLVLAGFAAGVALLWVMDNAIPHEHARGHHVHVHDADDDAHDAGPHHHVHGAADGHAHARSAEDERATARAQGLLVVGAMSLHRLPEGLAIGAAYASHASSLGLTLALAIGLQNVVEGMVMAAPLRRGGLGGGPLLALVTATGLAVPVAAVCGFYLSSVVHGALPPMLALAAGALLYLTSNEVIPESHSHGNELRATLGVVAGFVIIMLTQTLLGHAH